MGRYSARMSRAKSWLMYVEHVSNLKMVSTSIISTDFHHWELPGFHGASQVLAHRRSKGGHKLLEMLPVILGPGDPILEPKIP